MNQCIFVGRLVRDPELMKTESDKSYANITLAVKRSYKNENGEYDTDFIDCILWTGTADTTCEYCHKGDVLGVKGRVQTRTYEDEKGKHRTQEVIADKVTFLTSSKEKSKDPEMEA